MKMADTGPNELLLRHEPPRRGASRAEPPRRGAHPHRGGRGLHRPDDRADSDVLPVHHIGHSPARQPKHQTALSIAEKWTETLSNTDAAGQLQRRGHRRPDARRHREDPVSSLSTTRPSPLRRSSTWLDNRVCRRATDRSGGDHGRPPEGTYTARSRYQFTIATIRNGHDDDRWPVTQPTTTRRSDLSPIPQVRSTSGHIHACGATTIAAASNNLTSRRRSTWSRHRHLRSLSATQTCSRRPPDRTQTVISPAPRRPR